MNNAPPMNDADLRALVDRLNAMPHEYERDARTTKEATNAIEALVAERDAMRAENAELRKHAEAMFADLEEIGSGLTIAVASAPSKSAAAYRTWKEGKK